MSLLPMARRSFGFLALLWLLSGCLPVVAEEAVVIKVAVFDDAGANKGAENAALCLGKNSAFKFERLSGKQIQEQGLAGYDVVLFPGGSGSKQAGSLEEKGREKVRQFVDRGGGYVGVCAGAYLATNDYSWSLGLLNAQVIDKKHWARGTGDVELSLAEPARKNLLRDEPKVTIQYRQGPLLSPGSATDRPAYEKWALFETEVAKNGAPAGVMTGTTAIAATKYGQGRVICFSPHPETTPGLENFFHRGVQWAAGK